MLKAMVGTRRRSIAAMCGAWLRRKVPQLCPNGLPFPGISWRRWSWPRTHGAQSRCGKVRISSGILGERHRSSTGAVVGLDVDERDRAAINFPLGAVQSRTDLVGTFEIF